MTRLIRAISALASLSVLTLGACTHVVAPGNRPPIAAPRAERAIVYVVNSTKQDVNLLFDGKLIAGMKRDQYTWLYVSEGKHAFAMTDPGPGTPYGSRRDAFAAGHTYILRYDPDRRARKTDAFLGERTVFGATGFPIAPPLTMPMTIDQDPKVIQELGYTLVGNLAE